MSIDPIVRQIINRDCHVSCTEREVILHVISKLKGGMHYFRSLPDAHRRDLVRQCREHRKANFIDYYRVMKGGAS